MPNPLDKATLLKIAKITAIMIAFSDVGKELCDHFRPVLGETITTVIKIALICVPLACFAIECGGPGL
jgi:hypothetical protein